MSKHTPGPWGKGISPSAIVIWGESTMPRTVVARVPNRGYPEVATHDARLIAAAPDLLAALHGMLEGEGLHSIGCKERPPGYDDSRCCPVHIARAAIAKAEGK